MLRYIALFSLLMVGVVGVLYAYPTFAQDMTNNDPLGVDYGQYTGLSDQDLRVSVALVIRFILGFLGIIFLILTLYAGFLWMTSAGNEDNIEKAKKILWGSVIGLAIVLASYAITQFVIGNLSGVMGIKPS
ncbi:MAG: hypothetical protein COV60_03265 [Candidatus Magasanikbacteria bacterium CG11_big_fil_rev_8_21_14_0_20_43_7]|uniref:Uncharacterized protein n=1 Tax=Candidatus Magasanikbacteria bacterium CG11_big_fil_rev_8_21_14_0_20_43_7 TaxID=1974654 RepID=A0A2H0N1U0_9BACT|nr:MAG: hypothetical protein COV60_03265 [Candidatus Magasanikbacteria bacterium CG11_big_fil_rev_8_21_14_0_20_43_7]